MVCWWVLVHFDRSLQLYVWGVKLEAKPAVIRLFFYWQKLVKKRNSKFKNHMILDFFFHCQM
jgi:hypothetical protein